MTSKVEDFNALTAVKAENPSVLNGTEQRMQKVEAAEQAANKKLAEAADRARHCDPSDPPSLGPWPRSQVAYASPSRCLSYRSKRANVYCTSVGVFTIDNVGYR